MQIIALDLGDRRFNDLLEEYGREKIQSALHQLKKSAAKLMRSYINELPNGTYSAEDWVDNDGILDKPLNIGLDVVIADDIITISK